MAGQVLPVQLVQLLAQDQAPRWVALAVLVAMVGGVVAAWAELNSSTQPLAAAGLTVFLAGIVAAGTWVVADARQTGMTLRSAAWKGIKATGTLFWELAP